MTKQYNDYHIELKHHKLGAVSFNGESANHSSLPILAIHGWMDNAMSFAPLSNFLSHHHMVAVELPGHGQSTHLPEGHLYQWITYLETLYELLERSWNTPFILMGHSLGAGVATLLAGLRPKHLRSLILIEGMGILTQEEAEAPEQCLRYLEARHRQPRSHKGYSNIDDAVEARHKAGDLGLEAARLLVERQILKRADGAYSWTYDQRLRWPSHIRMSQKQADAFIKRIEVPSLLVTADDSQVLPKKEWLDQRKALIKEISHTTCPTGGHHIHMTRPQAVAEQIQLFLEEKSKDDN